MTVGAAKKVEVADTGTTAIVLADIIALVDQGLRGTGVPTPPASAYRVHTSEHLDDEVITVDVMLDAQTALPLNLGPWALFEANVEAAATILRKRMTEVHQRRDKLLALLATGRERVAAAAARVGGEVRFEGLSFAPVSAEDAISRRDVPFDATYVELDHHLATSQHTYRAGHATDIVRHLGFIARSQRRLAKQRDRLRAAGALFEIGASTEAAIAAMGLDVQDVLRRAAAGETMIELGGKATRNTDSRLSVLLTGGWLHLYGYVLPSPGGAFFYEGALRYDRLLDEAGRRELVGQPAEQLFDHPAMRAAGRIAGMTDRDGRMTDVKFKGGRSRLITATDIG